MKKLLFLVLLGLSFVMCSNKSTRNNTSIEQETYDEILQKEEDGFTYFIVKKNGKHGILDSDKNELIPMKYDRGMSWVPSLKGFYGFSGDHCVLFDRDANCLIDESRGYSGMVLMPTDDEFANTIVPDDAIYYYLVKDAETGFWGVCDKYGNEKIEPLYEEIDYYNNDDDEFGISSFVVNELPLYMYVDDDYKIKRYRTPEFEKCYKQTKQYIDGRTLGPEEDDYTIIRKYDDCIFLNFKKVMKTYCDGVECYQYTFNDQLIDRYIYLNDDGFVRFRLTRDEKYFYRECRMPNLKGKPKKKHTPSVNNSEVPSYNVNGGYNNYGSGQHTTTIERTPRRDICRACRGTGKCRVCDGTGQTKTKLRYDYNLGNYLDWETCNTCKGSGLCIGCAGDGYLDEGVDY